uniref:CxxxxCH/CxxCH domain-containing protein n=1 Tax=Nocardia concava TaxID=257281 RepID=UPI0012F947D3
MRHSRRSTAGPRRPAPAWREPATPSQCSSCHVPPICGRRAILRTIYYHST